jgi:hypothetical protein
LPPAEKAWSERLAASVQALRQAQRFQRAVTLPRPDVLMELALMLGMVFFGTWVTCQRHIAWRVITALMLTGIGAQLLYLFASRQNLWLPPLAILSPGLTAFGLAFVKKSRAVAAISEAPAAIPAVAAPAPVATPVPVPEPTYVYEPEPAAAYLEDSPDPVDLPAEVEEPKKPARKAAKKAAKKAATKVAAKKAAKKEAIKEAKKAPAKKAAKKTARKKAAPAETEPSEHEQNPPADDEPVS